MPILFGFCHRKHFQKGKKFNTQLDLSIGKVHRNVHTRMHNLQVYELLQQECPLTK